MLEGCLNVVWDVNKLYKFWVNIVINEMLVLKVVDVYFGLYSKFWYKEFNFIK